MAGEAGLIRFKQETENTKKWVMSIASDYAPPSYFERVETARRDQGWQPAHGYSDWSAGHCCHRSDSNFWFWMWALGSNRHEVHYYHDGLRPGYGGSWGGGVGDGERRPSRGRSSRSQRDGMSAGERTAAAAGGAALLAVGLTAYEHFSTQEDKQRGPLLQTQQLKQAWSGVGATGVLSAQEKVLHGMLTRVINAQQQVESTRVNRQSTYKWSSVVVIVGGVGLIAGALINSSVIVIAGLVALAAAATFMLMIWIISCIKDDTAPAKAVYEDYRKVATHFLASTISQDPPPYSQISETDAAARRQMAEAWAARADDQVTAQSEEEVPADFLDVDAYMAALAKRDLSMIPTAPKPTAPELSLEEQAALPRSIPA